MKTLKSSDSHTINGAPMFIVERSDPKAHLSKDELPQPGEVVEINGCVVTVRRAQLMEGSFAWKPSIAIFVEP